ncbi:MAG: ABC transporter permease subunit [Planctomycetes bacterium]|nr:ABC transporter permease subunit [Planctomycetota bacterium]
MNRGLLIKSLREVWIATMLFALALMVLEAIFAYVLPTFADQFSTFLLQLEFAQRMLQALLGTDIGDQIGPDVFSSMAWVHPVVLAIIAAHATILSTRVPVGEIDRGTIDMLLGLPVSRWGVYRCELVVFLASGLVVIGMGLAGNQLGARLLESKPPLAVQPLLVVVINLFCLYFAIGGLGWLVASLSDRWGKAVAVVFTILVGSFLLNFLAQVWPLAEPVSFLSVLNYYQPMLILRDGGWPVTDMVVLTVLGVGLWLAGGLCFARRDICTV